MPETTKKPAAGQTTGATQGPTFDPAEYAAELENVRDNHTIGTEVWFENDRVRIWDLALEPGQRVPFHCHDEDYFWTVTSPGRVLQRYDDGTSRIVDVAVGDTNFLTYHNGECTVHDLENIGDTFVRTVTVVVKDGRPS